ncbi:MAG TPA: hypothetical protein VHB20_19405 [Verrucomicrobiae bacterium]|jgi:hypothetical protein|nr:hypothetical protein [Verrucomicrobiae bacterium]
MRDLRDLLTAPPPLARFVIGYEITHATRSPDLPQERRLHFYTAAVSAGRFLLIEAPTAAAALAAPATPLDLRQLTAPAAVARTSDTDFYYNHPLFLLRDRAAANTTLENAFRARLAPVHFCLMLGLTDAQPGTFQWNGDHFTAALADNAKSRLKNISIRLGKPGEEIPDRRRREAQKLAEYEARHEAKMAQGLRGRLVRQSDGAVTQIILDDLPYRIELEYEPSSDLPLPWPRRIKRVSAQNSLEAQLYAAQVSAEPLPDGHFLPWRYLQPQSYVRGSEDTKGG